MFFSEIGMDVWRMTPTTSGSNWGDPTYAYHHTISGVVQPFTGDDSYKSGQVFENVRDLITLTTGTDIQKEDVLYYLADYHRVQYIQYYACGVLPHIEAYTTDSQWRPL